MVWKFSKSKELEYFNYQTFNKIDDVEKDTWNSLIDNNLYLSYEYLFALEKSNIDGLDFKYVQFYDELNDLVGLAYLQKINFKRKEDHTGEEGIISKIETHIREHLLDVLNIKGMICGNIFANGENGFLFREDVQLKVVYENLSNLFFNLRGDDSNKEDPSLVILKDFWPETYCKLSFLEDEMDYRSFEIDVNMVLDISPDWNSMDDYLASMVTKFRTKAKSCFKKSKEVNARSLTVTEIENYLPRIKELYDNVVSNADFQISKMNGQSFINFKQNLNEKFKLFGYFIGEDLVGFSTAFIQEDTIEAGYIGLDYQYNYTHAVYQKMLYDYVQLSIDCKVKQLQLGRTAEEIKSCLGAEAVTMKLFAKHRNSVSNKLLKPIVKSVTPNDFQVRKPFKKEFLEKHKKNS